MQCNSQAPSRRSFLKGAGIALAGTAAFGMAACSPKQAGSAAKGSDGANTKWDEEFDIVVVGAGIAGQSAAITVALEGEKATCLLAEKEKNGPGGNSPFCKGTIVYAKDEEAFFQYMKEMAGPHSTTPDDVLRAYAKGAVENFPWVFSTLGAVQEEALVIEPVEPGSLGNTPEWPEYEHCWSLGKFAVGKAKDKTINGAKHVTELLDNIIASHDTITYRKGAALTDLIQDPATKRILGAVVGGKNVRARKGVIMCTGGFESNPTMMENYIGMGGAFPAAAQANTGDGHRACLKIGADFWHMEHCAGFWMAGRDLENKQFTNNQIITPCPKQFGITVGVNGRRYYMDWDGYSNKSKNIPYRGDASLYVGSRHGHTQVGGAWPHIIHPATGWFVFDQAGLEAGAIPGCTDPVEKKYAHSANSIEELAEKMGVPADELATTVSRWNECCEKGEDIFFQRPAEFMQSVSKPPYYAQLAAPAFLNTDGGPVRNAEGRILDPDGKPIPGLYSAGEFGSVWSGVYQGGGNVAECMIFGRISARSALAESAS
ncbi:FAD-binding protein [Eggerthellaceae bacterium zg-1084]|uniref:FAD-dependent oxidoreductase n=1 Tax=Berryella wangjianweii TaxID=2734634 RepID=UPI001557DB68|nr:FAD-binding protein [Berryella wangjianweii]NPD30442.1 FAD-binding protein [Berryella wangjianweii]